MTSGRIKRTARSTGARRRVLLGVLTIAVVIGLGTVLSASALLLEEMSFQVHGSARHLAVLLLAMLAENLGYRQLTALWRARATLEWMFRVRRGWGKMTRSAGWQATPER